jgi:hypothetical protein
LKERVSGRFGAGAAAVAGASALRQDTNGAAAAATRATGRTDASSRTREPLMACCEDSRPGGEGASNQGDKSQGVMRSSFRAFPRIARPGCVTLVPPTYSRRKPGSR